MTQATTTDTRELIVESAYTCFRKQGLQKATIVDIAKMAGVSRSTIYEYFRDKASIVEACAEHASEQFYRQMSTAMDRGRSLEDKLSRDDWGPWVDWARPQPGHRARPSWLGKTDFTPFRGIGDIGFGVRLH